MLPNIRVKAIAGLTAAAMIASAAPAMAWGKKEQGFVAGVATALIIDHMIDSGGKKRGQPAPRYYDDSPRFIDPGPRYVEPRYVEPRYVEPRYVEPRGPSKSYSSVHSTPAAQAFKTYSLNERRAIQRELRRAGYYHGGIDGVFGSGTYNALASWARDTGASRNLSTTGGAFALYDGLLF